MAHFFIYVESPVASFVLFILIFHGFLAASVANLLADSNYLWPEFLFCCLAACTFFPFILFQSCLQLIKKCILLHKFSTWVQLNFYFAALVFLYKFWNNDRCFRKDISFSVRYQINLFSSFALLFFKLTNIVSFFVHRLE